MKGMRVFKNMVIGFMVVGVVLVFFGQAFAVQCDVDGDSKTGLPEAVFSLQVTAVLREPGNVQCDIDGNNTIGLPEAMYALQVSVGLNPDLQLAVRSSAGKTVAAVSESLKTLLDMQHITKIMDKLNLDEALSQQTRETSLSAVISYLNNGSNFSCGTVSIQSQTITFTFNGQCSGISSGVIKVTPVIENSKLVFSMVYENVQFTNSDTGISCTINGTAKTELTVTDTQITSAHTFTNLVVCGQKLNGTFVIVYDRGTGAVISVSGSNSNTYQTSDGTTITVSMTYTYNATEGTGTCVMTYAVGSAPVTVSVSYTYSPSCGMSGTATINQTICTFECIKVDPICGMPTAGTLTIDNITFDFSSTTCINPTVKVTVGNLPTYTVSMSEVKDLLKAAYSN